MIFNPNYTITIEIARFLVHIEEQKDAFSKKPLTPSLLISLRKSARLISTHYSTQIEGNRLTMEQVEKVVIQKGGFAGRERDEIEVTNYYKALEYLETLKDITLSEKLIKTIHSLVMNGTISVTPYRDAQNVIRDGATGNIVYLPPEAKDVKLLMKNLIKWVNDEVKKNKIPIPILASIVHYQIATIHPYYDGNGRTARLITTFLLHRYGYGLKGIYSLEEYYAKNITGYYHSLAVDNIPNYYMGRAEADITGFIAYFIEAMSIAFSNVNKYKSNQNLDVLKKVNSADLRTLNAQKRAIISLFAEYKEVSTVEIANHLGIKNRSAVTLIKKWLKDEFVCIGNPSNKSRTYQLTDFWEKYLS